MRLRNLVLAAADVAMESVEHYVTSPLRKRLGMHILEARINLLERQIDSALERARARREERFPRRRAL